MRQLKHLFTWSNGVLPSPPQKKPGRPQSNDCASSDDNAFNLLRGCVGAWVRKCCDSSLLSGWPVRESKHAGSATFEAIFVFHNLSLKARLIAIEIITIAVKGISAL